MIRRFRAFRDDERGAAAFLMVCGIVPLTLMVFFLVNTAKSINDKNRAQDAADAIALAHATETARALNTISMNQVTLTQAYATGVNAGTLYDTLNMNRLFLIANDLAIVAFVGSCGAYAAANTPGDLIIKGIAAAANALVCTGLMAVPVAEQIILHIDNENMLSKWEPKKAFDTASKAVKAADKMNKETINRFPAAVKTIVDPIGASAKATDVYFDESCVRGLSSSCNASDKRQGMELPLQKSSGLASPATLHFCGALFFGTGGLSFGSLGGGVAINGSYVKRGFPANKGPMGGGPPPPGTPPLTKQINDKTKIGNLLRRSDANGRLIRQISRGYPLKYGGAYGIQYPYRQSNSKNFFLDWVKVRVALKCTNANAALSGLSFITDLLKGAFSYVPEFEVYHPADLGAAPKLLPGINDFSEAYKPLAFVFRKPNARWAPGLFSSPKPGYYAYAQAIAYNPDEIGLYSQNWAARLIPAAKMNNLNPILSRMSSKASSSFDSLRTRMSKVTDMNGWSELNAH